MSERGSATVLMVAVTGVLLVLAVLVADVGGYLAIRLQLAAAADAAALAAAPVTFRQFGAVGSPAHEAQRLATANGARLVWCRCPVDRSWAPREVEVVVERRVQLLVLGNRTVRMSSRAEFVPTLLVSPSAG